MGIDQIYGGVVEAAVEGISRVQRNDTHTSVGPGRKSFEEAGYLGYVRGKKKAKPWIRDPGGPNAFLRDISERFVAFDTKDQAIGVCALQEFG